MWEKHVYTFLAFMWKDEPGGKEQKSQGLRMPDGSHQLVKKISAEYFALLLSWYMWHCRENKWGRLFTQNIIYPETLKSVSYHVKFKWLIEQLLHNFQTNPVNKK